MRRALIVLLLLVGAVTALAHREVSRTRATGERQTAVSAPKLHRARRQKPEPAAEPQPEKELPAERNAEPEEELEEVLEEEDLCPDDVEPGDRTLMLRLFNSETRVPVSGRVHLWRLGLPETVDWTAGDGYRAAVKVPKDGIELAGLPAGRYRVDADDQPLSAEPPPEFELRAVHNVKDIAVRPLRSFQVTLRVVDHTGRAVTARATMFTSGRDSTLRPPSWAKPRERKRAVPRSTAWCSGGFHGYSIRLGPDTQAFTVPERTRSRHDTWDRSFWPDKMSRVRLSVESIRGPRRFVAPCVPLTLLRTLIGAPPDADIRAWADADADADWRDIPITIKWGLRRFRYTVRRGLLR